MDCTKANSDLAASVLHALSAILILVLSRSAENSQIDLKFGGTVDLILFAGFAASWSSIIHGYNVQHKVSSEKSRLITHGG